METLYISGSKGNGGFGNCNSVDIVLSSVTSKDFTRILCSLSASTKTGPTYSFPDDERAPKVFGVEYAKPFSFSHLGSSVEVQFFGNTSRYGSPLMYLGHERQKLADTYIKIKENLGYVLQMGTKAPFVNKRFQDSSPGYLIIMSNYSCGLELLKSMKEEIKASSKLVQKDSSKELADILK